MKIRFHSFLRTMYSDAETKDGCEKLFVAVSVLLLLCDISFLVACAVISDPGLLLAMGETIQQANCVYGILLLLTVGFQLLISKVCKTEEKET